MTEHTSLPSHRLLEHVGLPGSFLKTLSDPENRSETFHYSIERIGLPGSILQELSEMSFTTNKSMLSIIQDMVTQDTRDKIFWRKHLEGTRIEKIRIFTPVKEDEQTTELCENLITQLREKKVPFEQVILKPSPHMIDDSYFFSGYISPLAILPLVEVRYDREIVERFSPREDNVLEEQNHHPNWGTIPHRLPVNPGFHELWKLLDQMEIEEDFQKAQERAEQEEMDHIDTLRFPGDLERHGDVPQESQWFIDTMLVDEDRDKS